LGEGWIVHLVPFQRSARVRNVPELSLKAPTASQNVEEAQATLMRKSNCSPAGFGLGSIFQVAPFHRSASVPAFDWPTAVQAEADRHETPFKTAPP